MVAAWLTLKASMVSRVEASGAGRGVREMVGVSDDDRERLRVGVLVGERLRDNVRLAEVVVVAVSEGEGEGEEDDDTLADADSDSAGDTLELAESEAAIKKNGVRGVCVCVCVCVCERVCV
jgi:hypothetical protein